MMSAGIAAGQSATQPGAPLIAKLVPSMRAYTCVLGALHHVYASHEIKCRHHWRGLAPTPVDGEHNLCALHGLLPGVDASESNILQISMHAVHRPQLKDEVAQHCRANCYWRCYMYRQQLSRANGYLVG